MPFKNSILGLKAASATIFQVTGGFLKRISGKIFKFVKVFIKENRNFMFKFLRKDAAKNLKNHWH
jgi:hypothetical protein